MCTPKNRMRPGFQLAGPPRDFGSPTVTEIFHVLVLVNRRGKRSINAAFHRQPRIGEIGHRSIGAHARRVEKRRPKPYQRNPQRQLPAKVVAAAIYKFRLWSCRRWFGWGEAQRWLGKRRCTSKSRL